MEREPSSEKENDMRRGIGIVLVVLLVLGGIGLAAGAYRAGEHEGFDRGIEQVDGS